MVRSVENKRGTKKKHVEREKNQREETADGISRVKAKY
jgi:hypothetical protein